MPISQFLVRIAHGRAVAREEGGDLLGEVGHQDAGRHHHERAGPPGDEPGEEPPEGTQDLVGPDVERPLLGEHSSELRGDESPGDQERREGDDPEDEHRGPGELQPGGVVDEQHDRDEDHDQVERTERSRDQDRRDLLGEHLFVGTCCHATPSLRRGAASRRRAAPNQVSSRESLHRSAAAV